MPHTFLIFDFGVAEEAAQQARHRIEGWKQGFRLGKKLQFKFERQLSGQAEDSGAEDAGKPMSQKKSTEAEPSERIRLILRLDFSNHEKHVAQTWIDRIPADEAFKSAKREVIRQNEAAFEETSEFFDSLS